LSAVRSRDDRVRTLGHGTLPTLLEVIRIAVIEASSAYMLGPVA